MTDLKSLLNETEVDSLIDKCIEIDGTYFFKRIKDMLIDAHS